MTTVLSITPSREVHCLEVYTKEGRKFVVDIYKNNSSNYDSEVIVLDNVSTIHTNCVYNTTSIPQLPNDNFEKAIKLIVAYLQARAPKDTISLIHNSCNCPFVSESDQNSILIKIGINLQVKVN